MPMIHTYYSFISCPPVHQLEEMYLICPTQGLGHIPTQIHPPGLEYGLERRKLVADSFADKIERREVVETSDRAFQGEVPVKRGIWQWEAEVVDTEA